jgi:NAD(P)-dependent dehydrogenase (short-subunit alcohol dehydrogenase family)
MTGQDRPWNETDVPDQDGRTALVTGANTGLGFCVAAALAAKGATVLLACRDQRKGEEAAAKIDASGRGAATEVVRLDLASLDSVREAAAQVRSGHDRLDLLVNNAGVMALARADTADGFELQIGTNHLGHFALTGLLLDRLLVAPGSRIVTVSSLAHRYGRVKLDDLQSSRRYSGHTAYAQSKLANLLFALELERRLAAAGAQAASLAAHPGYASTGLFRHWPAAIQAAARVFESLVAQDSHLGALPVLRAATDPAARGGEYYGPGGVAHLTGHPEPVTPARRARDADAARGLWNESQRLTGVTFAF